MSDSSLNNDAILTRKVDKMTFQIFQRDTPRRTDPIVTLERSGRIAVNGAASRLLGKPAEVELMYDPDFRAIGLWAAKEKTKNTFPALSTRGSSKAASESFNISCITFCKHINLEILESRRFKPTIEDDVLYFFLDQGVIIPVRKKQAKGK